MVIQRGWKILSDAGSTSASSTEANRSPTGLNSSSDDSNCSNQTTHSMVTSVASPVGNNLRLETTSSNISNLNATMKYVTTPQMAETALQKLRQRFSNTTPLTSSSTESGMRSLELVRIAVQNSFDKEIDELVKQYIETYFKPAFNNIKENLGQGAINEDALQKMSCALLENAKSQYKILRFKPQSSVAIGSNLGFLPPTIQENHMRVTLKRPAPNKPNATVIEMQKRFFPENMIIKTTQQQAHVQQQPQPLAQQIPAQILPSVGAIKAAMLQSQPTVVVPQAQKMPANTVIPQASQPRRQIFWNTAHISTNTKFVLDVQANQAFGFAPEGKERLASKHPELIRYLPDNEDRDWLVSQQIIPQQNRNSRFLFLIHDEVNRLYQTHEVYKNKPSIDLSLMMTFSVAEFMIQKMKIFFVDLNIKSRGLITNSYSLAGVTNSAALTAHQSNSHLRNALLLGTSAAATGTVLGSPSSTISNTSFTNTVDPTTSTNVTNTAAVPPTPSSSSLASSTNISSTEGVLQLKSKSSNLSSSHATLTALLNNNNSTPQASEKASTITSSQPATSNLPSSTPTLLNKLRK